MSYHKDTAHLYKLLLYSQQQRSYVHPRGSSADSERVLSRPSGFSLICKGKGNLKNFQDLDELAKNSARGHRHGKNTYSFCNKDVAHNVHMLISVKSRWLEATKSEKRSHIRGKMLKNQGEDNRTVCH